MALVVQKYGGTSVGTIDRIKSVAEKVVNRHKSGDRLVVVLSAMAGDTDKLLNMAREITPHPDPRELDVLLATGEQITIALFSIAVKEMGFEAKSLTGYQAKIHTDNHHGRARIHEIDTKPILENLGRGRIVVVAGFQGYDSEGNITTLGRGGSDTTAVALAAALKADLCEIYTDVDGVYTTDPNIYDKARKIPKISYDEMMEMASLGAKVLHIRSVEFAKKYDVPLHVRSSFTDQPGTLVVKEEPSMEKVVVSGVTYDKNTSRITITEIPDIPGMAAKVFTPISDAGIVVDMIIQGSSGEKGLANLSFTVPKADFEEAMKIVEKISKEIGAGPVHGDPNIAKVSIVGVGMRHHAGVATKMFNSLSQANINIMMISTSEIKISCVIDERCTELAVRVLHDAFGLDKEPEEEG